LPTNIRQLKKHKNGAAKTIFSNFIFPSACKEKKNFKLLDQDLPKKKKKTMSTVTLCHVTRKLAPTRTELA
jgi:hypothetical protein